MAILPKILDPAFRFLASRKQMSAMNDPFYEESLPKIYLMGRDDDDEEDEDDDRRSEDDDEEDGVGGEREIAVSYACEDCDYRWEVYLEEEDDEMDDTQYCPMCGSANTSQI